MTDKESNQQLLDQQLLDQQLLDKAVFDTLYEIITPNKQEMFTRIAADRTRYMTVVMENVHHEHNASAVMRTCECMGIQDLHVIEKNNEYLVQEDIALGASRWIDTHIHTEGNPTLSCLKELKSQGFKIFATTPHKDQYSPQTLPLDQPFALVFGTEFKGISQEVIDEADGFLAIPMHGFTESFNISVSVALLGSELRARMENEISGWKLSETEQIKVKLSWCKSVIPLGEKLEARVRKELIDGKKMYQTKSNQFL